jgi:hypothetical protein
MQHPPRLFSDGINDLGHVETGTRRENSTEKIEVTRSIRVANVSTLATDQFKWLVVVQREPTRHHLAMTDQELGL